MTLVFTAQMLAMATIMKNVLEANGIECVLRNQLIGAGMGELPPIECWPEVWVVDDADVERARQLIAAEADEPSPSEGEPWRCSRCGEQVDAVFAQCWNCSAER
jgi:hypothetical protein